MCRRTWLPIVVLIGVGVGLALPRVGFGGLPVEAARQATWRCISPDESNVDVVIHNAGSTAATASITLFRLNGNDFETFEAEDIPPGGTAVETGSATTVIRGPSRLLVDAFRITSTGVVQIACFKGN